jgi:hypothetical protein
MAAVVVAAAVILISVPEKRSSYTPFTRGLMAERQRLGN